MSRSLLPLVATKFFPPKTPQILQTKFFSLSRSSPRRDASLSLDLDIALEDLDLSEHSLVPDTASLAERNKLKLQQGGDVLGTAAAAAIDWSQFIDDRLFKLDLGMVPDVLALTEKVGLKKGALSLIPPQFETPLPPLTPAVFPPAVHELPPPPLELFDLDEQFR